MRTAGIFHRVCLPSIATALVLCLRPAGAWAATPEQTIDSKLGGGTIQNSPAQKLISAVGNCVKEDSRRPGIFVTAALSGGRADNDAIAPKVTVAAIDGLGANPQPAVVGGIVTASVKAAPAVVLETVREAVKAAPDCANAIVKAAVLAVPNPNQKVEAVPATALPPTQGYTKDESKESPAPEAEQLLPLAEAIAQAAYEADPSLSYQELLDTAKSAEREEPRGIYSVTDVYAGYYYPPLLTLLPGTTPTSVPTPPVVSK